MRRVFRWFCDVMAAGCEACFGACCVVCYFLRGCTALGWVSIYLFLLFSSEGDWGNGHTANTSAVNLHSYLDFVWLGEEYGEKARCPVSFRTYDTV